MNTPKKKFDRIIEGLKREYPSAAIALEFRTPFQLLISTILSAQCTDERVNQVSKTLFKIYKTPQDFAEADQRELEEAIFSTGFYKQKAKNIIACCKILMEKYRGEIPRDLQSLTELPGVGRKTAAVVLGNGYGIPAIAVDTHVKRLSNLLGFVTSNDPIKIEFALMELAEQADWVILSHLLATHGRSICIARRPKCGECVISGLCPSIILN